MSSFHGTNKRHSFFEGWYLKHQKNHRTLALIPSFHVSKDGKRFALLQVVTENNAYAQRYPIQQFKASKGRFRVNLGESRFTEQGVSLDIQMKGLTVKGSLRYGPLTPPLTDIMGPFRFVPFMQCNHGVISLAHRVYGLLDINGDTVDFNDGIGYIEKDWGTSFPESYAWTQCNWFDRGDCSVMLSIAHIPFLRRSFTGCICSILYEGEEYRLATYHGAKILRCSEEEIIVEQKEYRLEVFLLDEPPHAAGHALQAPQEGDMARTIHELPACTVQYRFWEDDYLLFDVISDQASFEFVKNTDENGDDTPSLIPVED